MHSEIGRRIKLVSISKPGSPVSPGDIGTVWRITQVGTVRVTWDNGCRFDLDPRIDQWEVLPN